MERDITLCKFEKTEMKGKNERSSDTFKFVLIFVL